MAHRIAKRTPIVVQAHVARISASIELLLVEVDNEACERPVCPTFLQACFAAQLLEAGVGANFVELGLNKDYG